MSGRPAQKDILLTGITTKIRDKIGKFVLMAIHSLTISDLILKCNTYYQLF